MEPVADKWLAFGWETFEIDGNDMRAVISALADARNRNDKPKAIVLRTLPGKGVPRIETSEKSHFFRIDVAQWDGIIAEFEAEVRAEQ
jgi:transketolase